MMRSRSEDPSASPPASPGMSWPALLGWWALLTVLQVLHVTLRDKLWVPDVPRAINAYLFSTVLYLPAMAGLGSAVGVAFAKAGWILRAQPDRGIIRFFSAPLVGGLSVFMVGLGIVVGISMADGAPLSFGDGRGIDIAVALIGLVGTFLIGGAIGVRWPFRITPPLALIGTFILMLAAWNGGAPAAVEFGGGPTDGFGFSPVSQLLRVALYASLAVAAWGIFRAALRRSPGVRTQWFAGGWAVAMIVGASLLPGDAVYARQHVRAECTGDTFVWCVSTRASRYRDRLLQLSDAPAVQRAHDLVLRVPAANPGMLYAPFPYQFADWTAPVDIQASAVARSVLVGMLPPFCERDVALSRLDPQMSVAALTFQLWASAAVGEPGGPQRLDAFLRSGQDIPASLRPLPEPSLTGSRVIEWLRDYSTLFEPCQPQGRVPEGRTRPGPPVSSFVPDGG
jgi:hypothetical protein